MKQNLQTNDFLEQVHAWALSDSRSGVSRNLQAGSERSFQENVPTSYGNRVVALQNLRGKRRMGSRWSASKQSKLISYAQNAVFQIYITTFSVFKKRFTFGGTNEDHTQTDRDWLKRKELNGRWCRNHRSKHPTCARQEYSKMKTREENLEMVRQSNCLRIKHKRKKHTTTSSRTFTHSVASIEWSQ